MFTSSSHTSSRLRRAVNKIKSVLAMAKSGSKSGRGIFARRSSPGATASLPGWMSSSSSLVRHSSSSFLRVNRDRPDTLAQSTYFAHRMDQATSPLLALPVELTLKVLDCLDFRSLLRCKMVRPVPH